MVCKKCSAAVSDEDIFCKVCGERLKGKDKTKQLIGVVSIIVIIAASLIYLLVSGNGGGWFGIGQGQDKPQQTEPIESPTTSPTTDPSPTPNFSKEIEEVWIMLEDAEKSVNTYISDYSYVAFISNEGYLFDTASKLPVTMIDLVESSKIDEKYKDENVYFLYLKPSDLQGFSELSSFRNSNELKIFAAYETKTGVALYANGYEGIIYRENLNTVLTKYSAKHGEILRPASTDSAYQEILEIINSYEFYEGGYNVRYMAIDEKYAVTVVSKSDNSAALFGYVLEKTETGYKVIVNHLESSDNMLVPINKVAPDFNLYLLPSYSLNATELEPHMTYAFLADTLKDKGEITDSDLPADFYSGTSNYLYIEFTSGKKYFGVFRNDSGWGITKVKGWEEVEDTLMGLEKEPPYYIIRQK